MNKSELTRLFATKNNLPMDEATLIVNIFFDAMKETLMAGGRIEIRGFGSFTVKEYKGYDGRNPRTGDRVKVDEKRLPAFRASKELRDYLNTAEKK